MANIKVDYVVPTPEDEDNCIMQLVLDFLFFALFFITPLLISTRFKHIFNAPKYQWVGLIAVLMTVIWLMMSIIRRSIVLPSHKTFLCFGLLIVWELLTIYRSPGLDLSLREFGAQLALFVICMVAAANVRSRTRIENLLHYAIAAAVIAAGYALLQYYGLDEIIFKSFFTWLILPTKPEAQQKIYSFMGHRNYLAGYLICVLPILVSRLTSSLAIAQHSKKYSAFAKRQSIVYGVCTMLLFVVVVLTQTRGSWIGLFAGLVVFFSVLLFKFRSLPISRPAIAITILFFFAALIFGMKSLTIPVIVSLATACAGLFIVVFTLKDRKQLVHLVVIVAFSLAVGGLASLVTVQKNPLARMRVSALERLSNSFDLRQGSAFQRALIWITAVHIITDSPANFFFGTGFGTFGLNYMPFQAKVLSKPEFAHFTRMVNKSIYAHSEYLHFWSEIGLIGIILMFLAAKHFYFTIAKFMQRCEPNYQNLLLLGMVSSTVAVLIHNIFSFSLHLPYTSSLFYCLIAFSLCYQGTPSLRLSWGTESHRDTAVAFGGGWVGLSIRQLPKGIIRAWAGWLVEPASSSEGSLHLCLTGKEQKTKEADLEISSFAQAIINVRNPKGQRTVWQASLVDRAGGEEKLAQLSLSTRKPVQSPFAPLVDWGLVLLVLLAGAIVVATIGDAYRIESNYRDADMLFRAQRFEESIIRFKKALNGAPWHGSILFDYGRALMDSNRNEAAVKIFERSSKNFVDPATMFNKALCYFKEGKRKESLEGQLKALELNPVYKQSLIKVANELMQSKRFDEAKTYIEKAQKYYPNDAHVLTTAGLLAMHQRRFKDARALLEKANQIEPNLGPARLNLAAQLLHDGEYERAEKLFESLVQARPDDVNFVRGYLDARLARFKKAYNDNPNDAQALKGLAMTYAHVAKFQPNYVKEATTLLRRYLALDKEDVEARYYLGGALLLGNYLDQAIEELEAARGLVEDSNPLAKEISATLSVARARRMSYKEASKKSSTQK